MHKRACKHMYIPHTHNYTHTHMVDFILGFILRAFRCRFQYWRPTLSLSSSSRRTTVCSAFWMDVKYTVIALIAFGRLHFNAFGSFICVLRSNSHTQHVVERVALDPIASMHGKDTSFTTRKMYTNMHVAFMTPTVLFTRLANKRVECFPHTKSL